MEAIIKTLLLEGIDEATIHRVLDVIEEEYEVVDEARQAEIQKSPFPKKALEATNKKYEEADKKAVTSSRIARKALDKLNKEVKHLKKIGRNEEEVLGHVSHGQAGHRYEKAKQEADKASSEAAKLHLKQKGLIDQGMKGVLHRPYEMHSTKKGDNFSFHKGHLQTSESIGGIN